jgi:hypothetical protein
MSVEQWWNNTDRINYNTRRKTCSSSTMFTTNPIWTGLAWNWTRASVVRDWQLTTSCGMAQCLKCFFDKSSNIFFLLRNQCHLNCVTLCVLKICNLTKQEGRLTSYSFIKDIIMQQERWWKCQQMSQVWYVQTHKDKMRLCGILLYTVKFQFYTCVETN